MIRDTDLRPHQYVIPGLLDEEEVSHVLDKIESHAGGLVDRTSLHPEISDRTWSNPVGSFIKDDRVIVRSVEHVEGFFRSKDLELIDRRVFEHAREVLSYWGPVYFTGTLRRRGTKQDFELAFGVEKANAFIVMRDISKEASSAQAAADVIERFGLVGGLPLEIAWISEQRFDVKVPRNPHWKLDAKVSSDRQKEFVLYLARFDAALFRRTFQKIFSDPDFDFVAGDWSAVCRGHVKAKLSVSDVFRALDKARLPGQQVRITFAWVLKDYRSFQAMTEMAQEDDNGWVSVSQSLVEFRWPKNTAGQLDVSGDKSGGFKVWLSFDDPGCGAVVGKALGVKLRTLGRP